MCRALRVSRSAFYAWLVRPKSRRETANDELLEKIAQAHAKSRKTYGSRRIHKQLVSEFETCSKNRVARLMKRRGLKAKTTRKFRATTNSKHSFPVAENLLAREFNVKAPNRVWATDITYVPTEEGWLYLATVMDLHSRMIVGWSMGERMTRELAIEAWRWRSVRESRQRDWSTIPIVAFSTQATTTRAS
jgi:transposase InsO family protein